MENLGWLRGSSFLPHAGRQEFMRDNERLRDIKKKAGAKKKTGERTGFRVEIARQVHASGISWRRAQNAINAAFALMTRAIWRLEVVDIPGLGTLKATSYCGDRRRTPKFVVKVPYPKGSARHLALNRQVRKRLIVFTRDPRVAKKGL